MCESDKFEQSIVFYFDFPTAESPNKITFTTLSSGLAAPAILSIAYETNIRNGQ
jgi:hypothetical protein